jgi:hypothetical protein
MKRKLHIIAYMKEAELNNTWSSKSRQRYIHGCEAIKGLIVFDDDRNAYDCLVRKASPMISYEAIANHSTISECSVSFNQEGMYYQGLWPLT